MLPAPHLHPLPLGLHASSSLMRAGLVRLWILPLPTASSPMTNRSPQLSSFLFPFFVEFNKCFLKSQHYFFFNGMIQTHKKPYSRNMPALAFWDTTCRAL